MTHFLSLITLPPRMTNSARTPRPLSTVATQFMMSRPSHRPPLAHRFRSMVRTGLVCMEVGLAAIALSWAGVARADLQPPATAPAELVQLLNDIDTAANSRDLDSVMDFISPDFSHDDGLDYDSFESALELFWERFDTLNYSTELIGWDTEGDTWVAETRTTIIGLAPIGSRSGRLRSVIESHQEFSDALLVSQSITREESQLTLGQNSPTVDVNLPEKVGVGQSFSFDAIVLEPLGDRILLGSAYDEAVTVDSYTTPSVIDLDLLSAGGVFKIGRAPAELGDRWISAIIVRDDGITAVTRRLQVVAPDDVTEELQAD